jgi:hypothetical protein
MVNMLIIASMTYVFGAIVGITLYTVGVISWMGLLVGGFCLMGYLSCLGVLSLTQQQQD